MTFITGDTHGRFTRLRQHRELQHLARDDHVIICGDFGGVWYADGRQEAELDRLAALPFTLLFADGNHENYDVLETCPQRDWHGGKVGVIRENVLHLLRGQIYEIEGKSFFVMGGAASHDIRNGVLDMDAPDFQERYFNLRLRGEFFRVKGLNWWPQELPSAQELADAWDRLCAHGKHVDVVISHCAPTQIQRKIRRELRDSSYPENALTDFLQKVFEECEYSAWYCGHYHHDMDFDRLHVLYNQLAALGAQEVR